MTFKKNKFTLYMYESEVHNIMNYGPLVTNSEPYDVDITHPYFDGVPVPSNFEIVEVGGSVFYIEYTGDYKEFGPKIAVEADIEDGVVYFNPIIGMPNCSSLDLEYADSFEYLADIYMKAAKIATYLIKNPLVLDEWEEE